MHLASPVVLGEVLARYRGRYAREPFVQVVDDAPWISAVGRQHHAIVGGFAIADGGRRLVAVAVLDNPAQGCGDAGDAEPQSRIRTRRVGRVARAMTHTDPSSGLLWQKPGTAVDAGIQAFLAGDDVLLDREFFLHDIAASRVHAEGLQRIGMLSMDESTALDASSQLCRGLSHPVRSCSMRATRMDTPPSRRG
jgi:hypothetical protein